MAPRPYWWAVALPLIARGSPRIEPPEVFDGLPLSAWTTTSTEVRGYHVLLIQDPEDCKPEHAGGDSCRADQELSAILCWRGRPDFCTAIGAPRPRSLEELQDQLLQHGPLDNPERWKDLQQVGADRFAFFAVHNGTDAPKRIERIEELTGFVLVFEGGAFLWPGVEVGFVRNVTLHPEKGEEALSITIKTRSLKPLILEVSSFFSPEECAHVIKKAEPHVEKSGVSHMDHDVGKPAANWRSSSTYFMQSDDALLQRLDRRVSALTRQDVQNQEWVQVLRYEIGERYAAHHDSFDIRMYKANEDVKRMTEDGLFNRLATVFIYLTDVEEGGETYFPRAGGLPQPTDFEDCTRGVAVSPQQGRIIIFYSLDATGGLDQYSLHGGCAVKKGTKWSANKWIWNRPRGWRS